MLRGLGPRTLRKGRRGTLSLQGQRRGWAGPSPRSLWGPAPSCPGVPDTVRCPCPAWRPGQGHPRLPAVGKPPAQGFPTEPCPHAEAPGYPAQPSPAPARPPLTEASAFPPSPHCPLLGRAGCRVRGAGLASQRGASSLCSRRGAQPRAPGSCPSCCGESSPNLGSWPSTKATLLVRKVALGRRSLTRPPLGAGVPVMLRGSGLRSVPHSRSRRRAANGALLLTVRV